MPRRDRATALDPIAGLLAEPGFDGTARARTVPLTASEQTGRYGPPELTGTVRRPGIGRDLYSIATSHVERDNLSIRTFIRRFSRLSLVFSKKRDDLAAAIALQIAYYNSCRRPGKLRMSPAMAATVTDRLWKPADLVG